MISPQAETKLFEDQLDSTLNIMVQKKGRQTVRLDLGSGFMDTLNNTNLFVEKLRKHARVIPEKLPLELTFHPWYWSRCVDVEQIVECLLEFFQSENHRPNVKSLKISTVPTTYNPIVNAPLPATSGHSTSLIQAAVPCGLRNLKLSIINNDIDGEWIQRAFGVCSGLRVLALFCPGKVISSACIQIIVDAMTQLVHLKKFYVHSMWLENAEGLEALVNQIIGMNQLETVRLDCHRSLTIAALPHLTRLFDEIPTSCKKLGIQLSRCPALFRPVAGAGTKEVDKFFDALAQKGCQLLDRFVLIGTGLSPSQLARLFQISEKMNSKLGPHLQVNQDRIFDEANEAFDQFVLSLPHMKQRSINLTEMDNHSQNWSSEQNERLLQALHQNTNIWQFSLQLGSVRVADNHAEEEGDDESEFYEDFLWEEKELVRTTLDGIFKRNIALSWVGELIQQTGGLSKAKNPEDHNASITSSISAGIWPLALAKAVQKAGHFCPDPVFVVFRHMIVSSIMTTVACAKKRPRAD